MATGSIEELILQLKGKVSFLIVSLNWLVAARVYDFVGTDAPQPGLLDGLLHYLVGTVEV